MGFYKYVNSETYDKLCNNKIDKEDEDYEDLIEKGFIINISIEEYIKNILIYKKYEIILYGRYFFTYICSYQYVQSLTVFIVRHIVEIHI